MTRTLNYPPVGLGRVYYPNMSPIDREERVKRTAIGAISKAVSRNPNLYIKEPISGW